MLILTLITYSQHFLETLDPFPGQSAKDIQDYLYDESLRIEPRNCRQPLKFVSSYLKALYNIHDVLHVLFDFSPVNGQNWTSSHQESSLHVVTTTAIHHLVYRTRYRSAESLYYTIQVRENNRRQQVTICRLQSSLCSLMLILEVEMLQVEKDNRN